ncbi:hypothetical protein ACFWA9_38355, partial [Kitasatospora sp. NPDC059973]|uniref:hypothetical protein n=1 Tax=Kitasatospora sp. NPDC059973 TaxID=3347020 RepID=UPI003689FCB0
RHVKTRHSTEFYQRHQPTIEPQQDPNLEQPLERRHVDALLDLDEHPSLGALAAAYEDQHFQSAVEDDRASRKRAVKPLARIGDDEAGRRAAEAVELHNGYHPKHHPEGVDLDFCPVCEYETFSAEGDDHLGMGHGPGQCLVCHYERGSGMSEHLATAAYYRVRWADDDDEQHSQETEELPAS